MILNLILSLALTGDLIPIQPQTSGSDSQPIPLPFQGETPTQNWNRQMETYNQQNQLLQQRQQYEQQQLNQRLYQHK